MGMALLMLQAVLSPAIALSTIDGVVSISVTGASDYDPVELALPRRDRDGAGAAKRARDHQPPWSKEHNTSGWSSAVMERGLALRRCRGCASSSCCSSSRHATMGVVQEMGIRQEKASAATAAHDVIVGGDQGQAGEAAASSWSY